MRHSFPAGSFVRLTVVAFLGWGLVGCWHDETNPDLPLAPANCILSEPTTGNFKVKVTINSDHRSVPIAIFLGDIETDAIIMTDTLTTALVIYPLPADERYSATALYFSGPDTILVVDSDDLSTSTEEFRDAVCWTVNPGEVDLRLRIR